MKHCHHHHHDHSNQQFNRAFAIAVILNLLYAFIQAFFAIKANSMSLLADAGHNLGDVLGLLLAWGANWLLTRPSNNRFSYGFKRTTILAAIANAGALIGASIIIAYESIQKFYEAHAIHTETVIIVALVGVLINSGTALLFIKGRHSDLNIKGAFLHLAYDALVSFGVVLGAIAIHYTHWYWLDPLIGLLIVLTILYGTWGLLVDSVNLIMDAVPRNINLQDVKNYLLTVTGITEIHDLHVWGLSSNEIALTAHLICPQTTFTDSMHHTVQKELNDRFGISHVTIQIERGDEKSCQQATSC